MTDDPWAQVDPSGRPLRFPPEPVVNASRPDAPPVTLAQVMAAIEDRIALEDADPEAGHGDIDGLAEDVLRAVAADAPDAREMAVRLVALLDRETAEGWRRWYA